jgi:Na+/phosphate symporter
MLNLIFNLIRAGILILVINLVPQVLTLIQSLSPNDIGRQIANTHTIFAIVAVLIEVPFADKIITLAQKVIPVKEEETRKLSDRSLLYLNVTESMPCAVALHQAQMEIARMGRFASENLQLSLDAFFNMESEKIEAVKEHEETVDILNQQIADKMVQLRSLTLGRDDLKKISMMTIACTDIERLSDHAENIVEYIDLLKGRKAKLSSFSIQELKDMSAAVMRAVDLSLVIFENDDYSYLDQLENIENSIDNYEDTLIANHVERLMRSDCNPVAGVVFSDLVTDLERCGDHAINIAYSLKERKIY